MSKANKIINLFLILLLITIFTECAPAKKNTYINRRQESSQVNASQLGRNKYYFSSGYQSKLKKNYKKK
jgi:hypothetical protein